MKKLGFLLALLLIVVAAYYLYDTFRQRTIAEKTGDIIYLEDRRELSAQLKNYLADENSDVRGRAALAVGRIGAPESGKLLMEIIRSDSSMDVVADAAFAIGLTDELSWAAELLDMAVDQPSKIAARKVEAAGRLMDSTMTGEIDMVAGFLTHPSPEVRDAACMALFRARASGQADRLISFIGQEPDDLVRVTALYSLVRMRIAEAAEVYEGYLADADPFVRALAVRGLGLSDNKETIHYLTIALNDSDPRVVAQAVGALSRKTSPEAKDKLVAKLSSERDEKLRVALINALTAQQNSAALDVVHTILSSNPSPNIVAAAVTYLATVLKDRAVVTIDSLQTLDDPYIRAACADAYAVIGTESIVSRLAVLFNDKNDMVRVTAFGHLLEIDSTNAEFYVGNALEDSCHILPVLAIDYIGQHLLASHLPRLKTIMELGFEIDPDIRLAAVDAANSFVEENAKDSAAVRILIAGLRDTEYVVRKYAAEVWEERFDENRWSMVPPAGTRLGRGKIIGAVEKYRSNPYATIVTNRGEIEMELYFDQAPLTVLNFISLAKTGFYEDLIFHRVVPNFVVQGGDPTGNGWGDPGYFIRCEYSPEPYKRGTVGIATSGKDTGGCQFFITHSPQPHLEARYTVFGQVLSGIDVVDQIVRGDTIKEVSIHEGEFQ